MGAGAGVGGGRGLAAGDRAAAGDQPADGRAAAGERGAAALSAGAGGLAARSAGAGAAAAARGVAADQGAAGDGDPARRLRLRRLGRSGASAAAASCGRRRCGRRSGRAIGRGRCCSSTGRRCRPGRGSPVASGGSTRWSASLPYSGAQTALFSLRDDDRVVPGGARARVRVAGRGAARVRLRQPALGRRPPRAATQVVWNPRFLHLRGHYAFHATACTPATPREKGSVEAAVRYLKTGFWPARRFGDRCASSTRQYADWRDRVCNRRAARDRPLPRRRAPRRGAAGAAAAAAGRASTGPGTARARVPIDGYLRHGRCFYRAPERLVHQRVELRFDRDQVWIVPPRRRGRPLPAQLRAGRLAAAADHAPRAAAVAAAGRAAAARRSRRPSSPTTPSCAHEQDARPASGCPTCSQAEGAARAGAARADRRAGARARSGPTSSSSRRCSRPRSSPATPPAPACASATPASRR